jgi:NAD(P)-dependent dehydrogenase (short-subunit alcohol dehydrogenase family)
VKSFSVPQLFSLRGRVALVTGGGGQLGKQIAEALYESGAHIILADMNPEPCRALAHRWSRPRQKVIGLEMNVSQRRSIEKALAVVEKTVRKVDILVNNAGVAVFTPFETRTEAEFDYVIDVNLKGVFLCSQIFGKQMMRRKRGAIINIGSVYGVVSADPRIYGKSGRNSSEVYGASKAGVIQMTRSLASYLAPHGIRVNAISPGGIFNHQDRQFVQNYSQKTPLGRMGNDHDLKGAVAFLASEASSYVTGHNLVVDGGFSIW